MAGSAAEKGTRIRPTAGKPPIEYETLALRCPVCNTEFTSEIPSVGEPEGRDTDLRPRYPAIDPLPTLIHVCPSCHYTAYREGYGAASADEDDAAQLLRAGDRPAPLLPRPEDEELEDLRRWIRAGELGRGLSESGEPLGAERYVLGARVWEFLRDEASGAADYYLRGAWCARVLGDRELERRCQREAIARLESALDHGLLPDADRPRAQYLVGELSRRAGEFARAVDLFSQLDTATETEEDEGALFAHLARRQLALAVVQSDINAVIAEEDVGLERDEE